MLRALPGLVQDNRDGRRHLALRVAVRTGATRLLLLTSVATAAVLVGIAIAVGNVVMPAAIKQDFAHRAGLPIWRLEERGTDLEGLFFQLTEGQNRNLGATGAAHAAAVTPPGHPGAQTPAPTPNCRCSSPSSSSR